MAVQVEGWEQQRELGGQAAAGEGRRSGAPGVAVIIIIRRRSKVGESRCCRDPKWKCGGACDVGGWMANGGAGAAARGRKPSGKQRRERVVLSSADAGRGTFVREELS